jgi:hypothetical protein
MRAGRRRRRLISTATAAASVRARARQKVSGGSDSKALKKAAASRLADDDS